jgi:HSP20 family protein
MTIMKRNPNLSSFWPGYLNNFFSRDLLDWDNSNFSNTGTTLPAVNIKETADNIEVQVAAPGMKKEDFKVELDGNMLTISSEKKEENESQNGDRFSRKEFSYQSFQRSFQLSREVVDTEKIEAKYENGVLSLVIPKKEEVKPKPSRLINIS